MNRLGMIASGLLMFSLVSAAPVAAQPATMLNGVENLTMAPIDVVVAPVVAVRTLRKNLEDAGMGPFGQSVTMVLGTPWIWALQEILTGARIVSGLSEIGLGLALTPVSLFTDVRERQLFDASTASPMVDREGAFDVVFGSHYIASH